MSEDLMTILDRQNELLGVKQNLIRDGFRPELHQAARSSGNGWLLLGSLLNPKARAYSAADSELTSNMAKLKMLQEANQIQAGQAEQTQKQEGRLAQIQDLGFSADQSAEKARTGLTPMDISKSRALAAAEAAGNARDNGDYALAVDEAKNNGSFTLPANPDEFTSRQRAVAKVFGYDGSTSGGQPVTLSFNDLLSRAPAAVLKTPIIKAHVDTIEAAAKRSGDVEGEWTGRGRAAKTVQGLVEGAASMPDGVGASVLKALGVDAPVSNADKEHKAVLDAAETYIKGELDAAKLANDRIQKGALVNLNMGGKDFNSMFGDGSASKSDPQTQQALAAIQHHQTNIERVTKAMAIAKTLGRPLTFKDFWQAIQQPAAATEPSLSSLSGQQEPTVNLFPGGQTELRPSTLTPEQQWGAGIVASQPAATQPAPTPAQWITATQTVDRAQSEKIAQLMAIAKQGNTPDAIKAQDYLRRKGLWNTWQQPTN